MYTTHICFDHQLVAELPPKLYELMFEMMAGQNLHRPPSLKVLWKGLLLLLLFFCKAESSLKSLNMELTTQL